MQLWQWYISFTDRCVQTLVYHYIHNKVNTSNTLFSPYVITGSLKNCLFSAMFFLIVLSMKLLFTSCNITKMVLCKNYSPHHMPVLISITHLCCESSLLWHMSQTLTLPWSSCSSRRRWGGKVWFTCWLVCRVRPWSVSGRWEHTLPMGHGYKFLRAEMLLQGGRPPEEWLCQHQQRASIMGSCCDRMCNFFGQQKNTNVRVSLPAVCFVWQIAMIILFGVFIRYDHESDTHWVDYKRDHNITSDVENDFYFRYPSKYSKISEMFLEIKVVFLHSEDLW